MTAISEVNARADRSGDVAERRALSTFAHVTLADVDRCTLLASEATGILTHLTNMAEELPKGLTLDDDPKNAAMQVLYAAIRTLEDLGGVLDRWQPPVAGQLPDGRN